MLGWVRLESPRLQTGDDINSSYFAFFFLIYAEKKKIYIGGLSFTVALGWLDAVACTWGDLLGFIFLLREMPCLQCSDAKSVPTEPVPPSEAAGCSGIGEEVPAAGFKAWTAKAPKTKSLLSAWKKKKKSKKTPRVLPGNPPPSPAAPGIVPGIGPAGVRLVGHRGVKQPGQAGVSFPC